ncbi:MAG TPA: ribbon-helix-helix protein, CopG family [Polyangiales bacterium]
MTTRVQVLLEQAEKVRLERGAKHLGRSLSAFMREAALHRLAELESKKGFSKQELKDFFKQCSKLESGREPDWDEHLQVIDAAIRTGRSRT